MFNYADLSDFEFEYLAQDIMEKMLGVKLHIFGKGQDTGIDLTEDAKKTEIIIQVKHYYKSSAAKLVEELRKEVDKVNRHKPKKYFVICSTTLLPQHVKAIFDMFQNFMESSHNILSIQDVDEFLQQEENNQIVKKNFKLWLHASIFLSHMSKKNVFFDSQVLLQQISDRQKYFVETGVFKDGLRCLKEHRALFIVGMPGTGKTITSQMLVMYFAADGYKVRYSTDGEDVKNLKDSLSDHPNVKEVILLDDCLGQRYFKMCETQGNQILSLIRFTQTNPNKILICNSRITIFNEAGKRGTDMFLALERKEFNVRVLNSDNISIDEKGKILYNHFYFSSLSQEHMNFITQNKLNTKLPEHINYTPRLCEYIVLPSFIENTNPATYYKKCLDVFDKPEAVWETEYDERIQAADRILLTTLFSISDTLVADKVLRECFNNRLFSAAQIDKTVDNYSLALSRLNGSMIKIVSRNGIKQISVINPSVNDFLKTKLDLNSVEKSEIAKNALFAKQIIRVLGNNAGEYLVKKICDGKTDSLVFKSVQSKNELVIYLVCSNLVQNNDAQVIIREFFQSPKDVFIDDDIYFPKTRIFTALLTRPLLQFYQANHYINSYAIGKALSDQDLQDAVTIARAIFFACNENADEARRVSLLDQLCRKIEGSIRDLYEKLSIRDVIEDSEVYQILMNNRYYMEEVLSDEKLVIGEIDSKTAAQELEYQIKDRVALEVWRELSKLPKAMYGCVKFDSDMDLPHLAVENHLIEIAQRYELNRSRAGKDLFEDDDYDI